MSNQKDPWAISRRRHAVRNGSPAVSAQVHSLRPANTECSSSAIGADTLVSLADRLGALRSENALNCAAGDPGSINEGPCVLLDAISAIRTVSDELEDLRAQNAALKKTMLGVYRFLEVELDDFEPSLARGS